MLQNYILLSVFSVLIFTLTIFAIQNANAELTYHSTIGVTGVSGSDNDHFDDPYGVAVDSSGNVYVAEYTNNRVQKFNSTGSYQLTLGVTGVTGSDNDHFANPTGVTVDSLDNVYVADYHNHRIQIFDSAGVYQSTLGVTGVSGTDNAHFNSPWGLTVDSLDNIYVADTLNHRVQKFNSTGSYQLTLGVTGVQGSDNSHFWDPRDVAVDSLGNVYVVDSWIYRIQKFNSAGVYQLTIGTGFWGNDNNHFYGPYGVTVDSLDNVYVADTKNHRIQKFDSIGAYQLTIGVTEVSGSDSNHFFSPVGVEVSSSDNVYVADLGNHRIQIFNSISDSDNDGVEDIADNCPNTINADQLNTDGDSLGNACDTDDDNDGILDETDSCILESEIINGYQDTDGCPDIVPFGTITIIKDTNPNNAQNFGFVTTGGLIPANFSLDDDTDVTLSNTRVYNNVVPGIYTITEGTVVGFPLTNIVCTDPDNGTTVNTTTRAATIDVDSGENITCTYTNTQTGSITIIKDTVPNNAQNFRFTTTGLTPINFTLDDDSDATLPNIRVYNNVVPGTYTITEGIVSGFALTNLVCTDPDNGTTVNLSTRAASIDLDSGESITCTYTNAQRGSITIIKDTVPNNAQNFAFTTTGLTPINFTLDDDSDATLPNTRVYTNLVPGSYTVTENPVTSFRLINLSCVDPDNGTTVNLTTRAATIDLDAGENITCTYTNAQPGIITIIEDTNPNGPQNFVYSTTGLTPPNFALDDDADAVLSNTRIYNNLVPGGYTITQNAPAGFSLTGLSCVDPDSGTTVNLATRVSTIDLDAGESITCTYTNTAN